jgi:hypothetical protein
MYIYTYIRKQKNYLLTKLAEPTNMGSSADEPTFVIFASFVAGLAFEVPLLSVMGINLNCGWID